MKFEEVTFTIVAGVVLKITMKDGRKAGMGMRSWNAYCSPSNDASNNLYYRGDMEALGAYGKEFDPIGMANLTYREIAEIYELWKEKYM